MRNLLLLPAAAGTILSTATAAEVKPSGGAGTGKANVQDLHFSARTDAVAGCSGGAVVAVTDGSLACDVPLAEPAGMAIIEKGTAGTKSPAKPSPK